jgi:Ran-binding protein 3
MASKPQAPKSSDKVDSLPQTSDSEFKKSGFGGFSSAASPFSGFNSSKPSTSSAFGETTGGKLSSFAGSPAAPTKMSGAFGGGSSTIGFGGSATTPAFGGGSGTSGFGGSLASGFKGFGGATSGAPSFATPGDLAIKGLKSSTGKGKPFGAAALGQASEDEDEDDDPENDAEKEDRQTNQSLLSQQQRKSIMYIGHFDINQTEAHETGEEGEDSLWTGRAKLYIMAGEPTSRGWKERGVGTLKFNITVDAPKRARFVLRAEGTHRLLLNTAVTRHMVFGGDGQGEKPKDNRLLFNSPNAQGEIEMHLLKVCSPLLFVHPLHYKPTTSKTFS